MAAKFRAEPTRASGVDTKGTNASNSARSPLVKLVYRTQTARCIVGKNKNRRTHSAPIPAPTSPATNPANQTSDVDAIVDHAKDKIDVAQAEALPARPIKNSVSGKGASMTFKGVGTMKEHGIPSGLRRNEFQDRVLEWNETSGAHLNDDELARIFDAEFPQGGVRIADRPELVQVIRKFYNAGKHGKQQQAVPTVQSLQYDKPKVKSGTTASATPASDDSEDETAATGTNG